MWKSKNDPKKEGGGYKIVLTAERTLESQYAGGIFLGFNACVPQSLTALSIVIMFWTHLVLRPSGFTMSWTWEETEIFKF